MKTFIICISASFLFLSCGTKHKGKNHTHMNSQETEIEFYRIQSGTLFGAGEEGFEQSALLVTNETELTEVVNKMNTINPTVDLVKTLTQTYALDEHNLIVIFDKVRGSGGYAIQTNTIKSSEQITMVYVKTSAPDGPATTVMTQPFEIIAVPTKDRKPLKLIIIE